MISTLLISMCTADTFHSVKKQAHRSDQQVSIQKERKNPKRLSAFQKIRHQIGAHIGSEKSKQESKAALNRHEKASKKGAMLQSEEEMHRENAKKSLELAEKAKQARLDHRTKKVSDLKAKLEKHEGKLKKTPGYIDTTSGS